MLKGRKWIYEQEFDMNKLQLPSNLKYEESIKQ